MRLSRYPVRRGLAGRRRARAPWAGSCVAAAGGETQPTSTTTTSHASGQPSLSQLAPGLEILDGSITGNGPESGRKLDSSQATAFLQAWLPESIYGAPPFENPPGTLPVYQVNVDYKYLGTRRLSDGQLCVGRHFRLGVDAAAEPLARGGRHSAALDPRPRTDGGRVRRPFDTRARPQVDTHPPSDHGNVHLVLHDAVADHRGGAGPGRRDRPFRDSPTCRRHVNNPDHLTTRRRPDSVPRRLRAFGGSSRLHG